METVERKDYLLTKSDGTQVILYQAAIDTKKFVKELNDHSIVFVELGGAIMQKHALVDLSPVNILPKAEEAETEEVVSQPIID